MKAYISEEIMLNFPATQKLNLFAYEENDGEGKKTIS